MELADIVANATSDWNLHLEISCAMHAFEVINRSAYTLNEEETNMRLKDLAWQIKESANLCHI